jgi:hypothetical protein
MNAIFGHDGMSPRTTDCIACEHGVVQAPCGGIRCREGIAGVIRAVTMGARSSKDLLYLKKLLSKSSTDSI